MRKYIVYLLVLGICLSCTACKKNKNNVSASVIQVATMQDLLSIDTNVVGDSFTVYQVGTDYFAYFPSTGKIEAIYTPSVYDAETANVIDSMYKNTFVKDGDLYVVTEQEIDTIEMFGQAVESRIGYITKELDNCTANLAVSDTEELNTYKEQLLAELEKLLQYQADVTVALKDILMQLDPETQAELAKRISVLMDQQFLESANLYAYTNNNAYTTEQTTNAITAIINAQEIAIKELTEKYETLSNTIVNKCVTFDNVSAIINTPQFQEVFMVLETYVSDYVEEYKDEYNSLNNKIIALESLYSTLTDISTTDYNDALKTLRTEYEHIITQQKSLETQINYLQQLTADVVSTSESAADINSIITAELERQQIQLDLLNEICNQSNITNIEILIAQQDYLYNYIKQLETVQESLATTVTTKQYAEIKEIHTQLEELYDQGVDIEELKTYIDTVKTDLGNLDSETKQLLAELSTSLENSTANDIDSLSQKLKESIDLLETTLATQDTKMAEQEKVLTMLIKTTTNQVQADIMYSLENSIAEQESALQNEKLVLETLINNSSADLKSELSAVITNMDTATQAELNRILLLAEDTTKTDELAQAISVLRTDLETDIAEQETVIAGNKTALETMVNAKTAQVKTELESLMSTVDTETQAKIQTILDELDTNNANQTEALNNAVIELQVELSNSVTATETKLANEKAVLEALFTSSDNSLKSELSSVISTLDTETQKDIQEIIDLLDSKDSAQTNALNTAIDNLEKTLDADIAATEAKLATEKSVLTTLISDSTSSLRTELEMDINSVSDDLLILSTDLSALSDAYTVHSTETDTAVANLRTDYETYKTTTNNKITAIENIITILQTDNSTTEVKESLELFKTETNNALAALDTEIGNKVTELNDTITEKYNEVNTQVTELASKVTAIQGILDTHGTDIADLQTQLTTLETTVDELSTQLADLLANPYELPAASDSILGGVKVDGTTITADTDGTLHVLVGYDTLDEFYAVGTVYDTQADIRNRILAYCTKPYKTTEMRETTKTAKTTSYSLPETYTYTQSTSTSVTRCAHNGNAGPQGGSGEITESAYNNFILEHGGTSTTTSTNAGRCSQCSVTITVTTTISVSKTPKTYTYGYTYTNPYTNEEVDVYPVTQANIPTTVSVTGNENVTVYKVNKTLNTVQLNKLYNASVITSKTVADTYCKDLYNHTQVNSGFAGKDNWVYCGTPTVA